MRYIHSRQVPKLHVYIASHLQRSSIPFSQGDNEPFSELLEVCNERT